MLTRMPNAWSLAINQPFIPVNPNTQPLHPNMGYKGDTSTTANPVCQASAIKGA